MQFSANETVQAICRTLFHSLWQGLLLAVAAGAVVLFTKNMRAAVRYNILTGLLVVFAAAVACTFCCQLSSITGKVPGPQTVYTITEPVTSYAEPVGPGAAASKPLGLNAVVINWLTANAGAVVLAWLLIIAFRSMQMLIGLKGIHALRHKGITPVDEYWESRLKQLAQSIRLAKPVRLMQSAIAKVPMVTGHLKPLILLPVGIVNALPQDEIEAILLHELAHIRRKDYLVNMLQNLCEIIFFFNPAVLWVSSLIKDERENCCDDIALGTVKNKKQFIHALISFQEYQLAATNYTVGFPGRRKDHLLNRVKRIITNNNKTLNNMEKTLLATGIVILSFITFAFAHAKHAHTAPKKAGAAQNNVAATNQDSVKAEAAADSSYAPPGYEEDTTKRKKEGLTFSNFSSSNNDENGNHHSTMNATYEGKDFRIVQDADTVTALYIDGERVPREKIAQYQPFVDKINVQLREEQQHFREQQEQFRRQQEQFRAQQQEFHEQQEIMRRQQDSLRNGEFRRQQEHFREEQEKFRRQQEEMRHQEEIMRQQQDSLRNGAFRQQQEEFRRQQEHFRKEQEMMRAQQEVMRRQQDRLRNGAFRQQQEQFRLQQEIFRKQQEQFREQQRQMREQQRKYLDSGEAYITPPVAPVPPVAPASPAPIVAKIASISVPASPALPVSPIPPVAPMPPAQNNKTIKLIIAELKEKNIITDTGELSFKLTKNEFIVNGEKQPDALFEEIKSEHLQNKCELISYVSKDHGRSASYMMSINGTVSKVSTTIQ